MSRRLAGELAARPCATFSLTSWPKNTISPQRPPLWRLFDFPVPETHIMSGSALFETFTRAPLAFDHGEG
ncbi:MAG: hypothetical protein E5V18_08575, partial [Mesorhizobium sp.]